MQVWDGSAGAEVSGGSGNAVAAGDLSVMAANIVTIDGLHDVPTKDATGDTTMRDVIGKKDDTSVSTPGTTSSLISYVKGVLDQLSEYVSNVYYVDPNVASSGVGTSWDTAYKTLDEAIAVATTRGDTIYMAPGDYDEGNVVNITTQGLRIICPSHGDGHQNQAMLYSGAASHLMTINAHEVLIDGIGFSMPDDTKDAIHLSTTGSFHKITIQNCRFDGWSGEYAIKTNESPDVLIKNCTFRSWNTCAVQMNATRGKIENCLFHLVANKIGIEVLADGAGRPDIVLKDNVIKGVNSGDTGIKITNAPDEDALVIEGNKIVNCATPITLAKYTSWYDGNNWGTEDYKYHSNYGKAELDRGRCTKGKVYYVDDAATTAGDGRCWASALKLPSAAIALASDFDTITIAEGAYTESAVITITQKGLRMLGYQAHEGEIYGTYIFRSGDHDLIHVEANSVEIGYLSFLQNVSDYDCIKWASDTGPVTTYQGYIHHCSFKGSDKGEHGIFMVHGGEAGQLVIDHCQFIGFATAAINSDGSSNMISNCVFDIMTAKIGIAFIPHGSGRPWCKILNNVFYSDDVTNAIGINVTNTPGVGNVIIDGNHFAYFADDNHAVSKRTGYCGINWRDAAVLPVT